MINRANIRNNARPRNIATDIASMDVVFGSLPTPTPSFINTKNNGARSGFIQNLWRYHRTVTAGNRLQTPPEEELDAVVGHSILHGSHGLHQLGTDGRLAGQGEAVDEVLGDGDQGLFRPRLEPVHGAARHQTGEPQRPGPELLAHLRRTHQSQSGLD